jgi:hypothetical protein
VAALGGTDGRERGVSGARSIAFVIPHPYVDALACFREPIKFLADAGWHVDLYTMQSPLHPVPFFGRADVRIFPLEMSPRGAVSLVSSLVLRRPKYDWIVTVPQWALHYASVAARFARIPMGCISDELRAEAEATTPEQRLWRARERRAHQRCRWTIALTQARADFVREDNQLGADHRIFVVPNAAPGASTRVRSRYYQDTLGLPDSARLLLHAGSLWWSAANELIEWSPAWTSEWTVVFQGRFADPRVWRGAPRVRLSEQVLPAALLDYATSSATIGLALYDASRVNNRLMGTASGKVALYMKNALPVIATDQSGLEWVEREQCGVLVASIHEIPAAADRIWSDYDAYVRNVCRVYDASMEFTSHFRPVADFMAKMDASARHVAD